MLLLPTAPQGKRLCLLQPGNWPGWQASRAKLPQLPSLRPGLQARAAGSEPAFLPPHAASQLFPAPLDLQQREQALLTAPFRFI